MMSQAEWKVRMDARRRRLLGFPIPLIRAAILALGVASCATPPAPDAMVPTFEQPPAGAPSGATLAVGEVSGGGGDQAAGVPFGRSAIDDDGFRAALASTMEQSGLFRSVVPQGRGAGDWRLDAR